MELQDPYGGGYWATRDRWTARNASEADTAYKLALIAQSEREAQEAAQMAPYEAQKRQYELSKLANENRRGRVQTAQEQDEYVRQRMGPLLAAHARGELSDLAFRAAAEQEVLRAASEFGLGESDVQTLLQAGPREWGMFLEQALSVKDQRAPPPAPVTRYVGDRVEQLRWNPRTQKEEPFGEGPRFNPKSGVNVTLDMNDQLKHINTLRDDRNKEMAPLFALQDAITKIRAYASQPDALKSQQLQAELANLASTSVRAQAELNKYGNFGDLPTRFFGAISKFASGTYTREQLKEALALAELLERDVLLPSMQSIDDYYSRVADYGGVPSSLVGRDMGRKAPPDAPSKPRKPLSAFGK